MWKCPAWTYSASSIWLAPSLAICSRLTPPRLDPFSPGQPCQSDRFPASRPARSGNVPPHPSSGTRSSSSRPFAGLNDAGEGAASGAENPGALAVLDHLVLEGGTSEEIVSAFSNAGPKV